MRINTLQRAVLPLGLAICLTASFLSTEALAQQESSGRSEFPGRRVGGGTRGGCVASSQPLVALNPASNLGVTTSDAPSLYFLMPTLDEPQQFEFILRDSDESSVYETTFEVSTTEEIAGVHLPTGQLQADKDYHWYFSMICDPQDRSQNVVLTGWLRRVALEGAGGESDLQPSLNQMSLYQEAGLWTDAIATLVELRQAHPNDNSLLTQWTQLLQMLELETVQP